MNCVNKTFSLLFLALNFALSSGALASSDSINAINGNVVSQDSQNKSNCSSLASQYRVAIVAAGNEAVELHQICDQSLALLQSQQFRTNLIALKNAEDKVLSAVSAAKPQFLTFSQLADVAALKHHELYKFRSHFVLHGTYFNTGNIFTGKCKLGDATMDCKAYEFEDNRDNEFVATRIVTLGADSILESVIGRKIHERWRSNNPYRKSCAINTFSHELMHAFSKIDTTGYHENYFIDTLELDQPANSDGYPIATYLVGSAAQCTWLQQSGHIGSDVSAFTKCVHKFGVNKFNSDECREE